MGALDNLQFVKKAPKPASTRTGKSPIEKGRDKLLAEIDMQIALARDPSYVVRKERTKRDGTTAVIERKPKSWVTPGDDGFDYLGIRYSNKLMPVGGKRGSFIKCAKGDVVEALNQVRTWVSAGEADELIEKMIADAKRKPRSNISAR